MAEDLVDHRQRHAAQNEQRRKCVVQIVDTDTGQFGLRPYVFPEPLDVLKRLAFGIAREHPFTIFEHTQPDRAQKRGGRSADRPATQAALLRGGGGLDSDGGFQEVSRSEGSKPHIRENIVVAATVELDGKVLYLAVSLHRTDDGTYQYNFTFDNGAGGPGSGARLAVERTVDDSREGTTSNFNLFEHARNIKPAPGAGLCSGLGDDQGEPSPGGAQSKYVSERRYLRPFAPRAGDGTLSLDRRLLSRAEAEAHMARFSKEPEAIQYLPTAKTVRLMNTRKNWRSAARAIYTGAGHVLPRPRSHETVQLF